MISLQYVISGLLIATGLCILAFADYARRRSHIRGAKPFSLLCLASGIYVLGYSLELSATTLAAMDLWSKVQYIGLAYIPFFWIALSFHFNPHPLWHKKAFRFLMLAVPTLTLIFRLLSPWIPFQYAHIELASNGYFNVLVITKGFWYYIHYLYFVLASLVGIWRYSRLLHGDNTYLQKQSKYLLIASIIPVAALLLNLSGLVPLGLDSGAFITGFNFIFFTIAIFKYHFIQMIPLSRDQVFLVMRDAVLVLDADGTLVDINPAAEKFFPNLGTLDRKTRSLPSLTTKRIAIDGEDTTLSNLLTLAQKNHIPPDGYAFSYKDSGVERHYLAHSARLTDGHVRLGTTVVVSDQTRHVRSLKTLEYAANHDGLTGIFNRRHTLEIINELISTHNKSRHVLSGGIMLMDIDHFKNINDTYGHIIGDIALVEITRRMSAELPPEALFGRFGGEEFLIFVPELAVSAFEALAQRIIDSVAAQPLHLNGNRVPITLSAGTCYVSNLTQQGSGLVDIMILNADTALYAAKESGRNRVCHGSAH